MTRKTRVGLVFGGRSGEHEISLLSARSIFEALDRERYEPVLLGIDHDGRWHLSDAAQSLLEVSGAPAGLRLDASTQALAVSPGGALGDHTLVSDQPLGAVDVFFPVLHGTYGEDGTVQGLLEMAGAPYVGSGVLGSSVGMDKDIAKRLLRAAGLKVVDWEVVRAHEKSPEREVRVLQALGLPCFVKPANMGSSVGVSKVKREEDLGPALQNAFKYDTKALVERGMNVREIEIAVLGNEAPQASVAGEIIPSHEFYSYEAKYTDEHGAALRIPAELTESQHSEVRAMALQAFCALELSGLARVDFFLDRSTHEFLVNEVNTMPGFTRISMYPKLWEASGLSYPHLVDRLISLALERHATRRALCTRYSP